MNGPAPRRLSRRGGDGSKPGSLQRTCGRGREPGAPPTQPWTWRTSSRRSPSRRAGFPLLSAPLLPRDGTLTSSRAPPSKRSLWTRAPKFGHRGKVAATTEPFPRRKQVSGGPGNPADKSPRRDRQRPVAAGGNRRRAPLAWAPKSRVRGARARPKVTFGRSQVSPPVFAATQPHCSSLRPRLSFAAWRAACCPHPGAGWLMSGWRTVPSPARGHRPGRSVSLTLRTGPAPRVSRPPGRPC